MIVLGFVCVFPLLPRWFSPALPPDGFFLLQGGAEHRGAREGAGAAAAADEAAALVHAARLVSSSIDGCRHGAPIWQQ